MAIIAAVTSELGHSNCTGSGNLAMFTDTETDDAGDAVIDGVDDPEEDIDQDLAVRPGAGVGCPDVPDAPGVIRHSFKPASS